MSLDQTIADLVAEHDALDALVADDPDAVLALPTPAAGWTVADQLGHLGYFDRTAALAITDREAFAAQTAELLARIGTDIDQTLEEPRALTLGEVLEWWRESRRQLVAAARTLEPAARLPWYGPPMGARSFLTARLMETWAHGQDIADALGVDRLPTARLRQIAHLGVITRSFTYTIRGRTVPDADIRVELAAPDGDTWTWQEESDHRVRGTALDFCLVVTQRRHLDQTALAPTAGPATEWLTIAQAFAGGPTETDPARR